MKNGKRNFNVLDVIGLVAGILTPVVFVLVPLLTRSKFVPIFRDMNLSLPAVTSFYLDCPFILFAIAGLIPGALMVLSTIFLTEKKENYCTSVISYIGRSICRNVCNRPFLAIMEDTIRAINFATSANKIKQPLHLTAHKFAASEFSFDSRDEKRLQIPESRKADRRRA